MKIVKRIVIILLSTIMLLFLGVFIALRFYEDDIVSYAFERSKSSFTTTVNIEKIEISFWETFPKAALHLTNVYVEETFDEKDTLIYAESVYLKFSLLNLLRGKYQVNAIDVENAMCDLERNVSGEDNWHFWKKVDQDTSKFKLDLEKIQLLNTRVMYADNHSEFYMDFDADNAKGKGNFLGDIFDVDLELEGSLSRLINGKQDYSIDRHIEVDGGLIADNLKQEYSFDDCEVDIEAMHFLITGFVNTSTDSSIDLTLKGDDIDLDDLIESLPEMYRNDLKGYSASGDISLDLSVNGKTSGKNRPNVDLHSVMHDGRLKHRKSGTTLESLSYDVRYNSGRSGDQLKISQAECRLHEGQVSLKGNVNQLSSPELDIQLYTKVNLTDLRDFLSLDTLDIFQGELEVTAQINGALNYNENDTTYNWRSLLTSGNAKLNNGVVRIKESNRVFDEISGSAVFDKRNVILQNFSGKVNGSDFAINGKLDNLIPYLSSPNEHLVLDATLNSNLIDFTNLVETESSSNTSNEYKFELPTRVEFDLKTNINKFVFRKFEATKVRGVTKLHNGLLTIDPVSFKTADGEFSAQISMDRTSGDMYRLNCLATLQQIDIRKLFTEFENFDQTFIQDHHLKGKADATVQFRTPMTTSLNILSDKVESVIDIAITDGQLIGLESLQDIAVYIKDNKLIAPFVNEDKFAERMKEISFSRLENVIEIHDRLITIPLMDIKSSALDITAKGQHTFDNEIDYAIGFNLRDVLVRKERDYSEADDGLGKRLYISMKGTTDDPQFSMDRQLAKEIRQEEMQAEKANMKALLKEELGLFKRDKSVGVYKNEVTTQGSTMTMEWEENDKKPESKPEQKEQKPEKKNESAPVADKPKKKVPKWLEEK